MNKTIIRHEIVKVNAVVGFETFNDMHHKIAISNAYKMLRNKAQWLNNHEAHINVEQNKLKKLVAALQRGHSFIRTQRLNKEILQMKVYGNDTAAECLLSQDGVKVNLIVCHAPVNIELLLKIIK
ncbi:hypothetical protein MA9V2_186 [Chryseobacterium phage MA9V-2]|nr:hypothetical protein MA9V2_186 [Chryseobacterium phage MA9V-2]